MAARKKNMTKDAVLSPPVSEAGDDGAEVAEERTEVVRYAAAIDVAKGFGMVCTRVPGSRPDRRRQKVWQAGATYGEVVALMDHLRCEGIQRLVLESTPVIRGNEDQRRCYRRWGSHVRVGDGKGKSGIDERPQRDELRCRLSACRKLPR